MIVTRETAIPVLSQVVVALVTSTIRDLPTEVRLGREHGLDRECVVNCDNFFTVPKQALGTRRSQLDPAALAALRDSLPIALELD